ncbi:MAG TPA: TolC family protein [Isosphaeraceae bacterium]|nr:TolC family protein [Isosphaeraceae bacterium]
MRSFLAVTIFAVVASTGLAAQADSSDEKPNAPAPPEQRRIFDWLRRREPAPKPASVPAAKPQVPSTANGRASTPPAPRPPIPATSQRAPDAAVRRVQVSPSDVNSPLAPGASPTIPAASLPTGPAVGGAPAGGGQSIVLEAALYGALTSNPDLVSMRQGNVPGNAASPEAVEVARHFPTTLNPTLWIDARPLNYERIPHDMKQTNGLMYFSLRQPVELGHQTRYRYAIAKAAYNQQQWTIVQAELMTLVQTYRFFQTAAYRRERLRIAAELADFNDRLVQSLGRRLAAGAGTVLPADVTLARVESRATRQLVKAARQDYINALTDLQNQIGTPETAGTAEPLGDFVLPGYIPELDDEALVQTALNSRPEIFAARAQAEGARAAVCLARGDRIPTPVVGSVYERDEKGTQFFGFVFITPIPIANDGAPLVRQRQAEYRRAVVAAQEIERRTVTQVRAAVAKWNAARALVTETEAEIRPLTEDVASIDHQFQAGQADITKLLQAKQRLIQLENARLDSMWQATQAQADLLTALGAPTLIESLRNPPPSGPPITQPPSFAPAPAPPVAPAPSAPAPRGGAGENAGR